MESADCRAGLVFYPDKRAVAPVAKHHSRSLVGESRVNALDLRINIARDPEDVRKAVVVEVDNARSPTHVGSLAGQPGGHGLIFKFPFAQVAIETGWLKLEMRLEDIQMPIQVVIADADSHPSHFLAVGADSHASHEPFFAKGAVMVIQQQQTLCGVAGHKDVGPSVFVRIEGNSRQSVRALDRLQFPIPLRHR